MITRLLYYSCILVIGLTAMDAITLVEGITYGRIAFILMLILSLFHPHVLIPKSRDTYQIILFVFICYVVITIPFSEFKYEALVRWFMLIQYLVIIVVVSNVMTTKKQVDNMLLAFCLGTLYIAYKMIFEYSSQATVFDEYAFRSGSVGNPNENAFLVVYSIIFAYLLIKNGSYSKKIVYILYLFIAIYIVAVFATGSRMGFILMSITVGAIGISEFKFKVKYLALVSLGLFIMYYVTNNFLTESTIDRLFNSYNDIENMNLASRENIWSNALIMIKSYDFNVIIGNGWATFPNWHQKYFGQYIGSHNFYISLFYTTGIVGVFIILVYFINLFKAIKKTPVVYYLLLIIPLISMMSTNWEYRRWLFLIGLFVYKISAFYINRDLISPNSQIKK